MTIEQQLRDRLERDTSDVVGGPDLDRAIRDGRRSRRTRRRGYAVGAVAALSVGVLGVGALAGGSHGSHSVARDHDAAPAAAPQAALPKAAADPSDWVPGTDTDQKIAASIAQDLPSLPGPDDVYPSDGHTAGPIPDADWASAQDWQANYTIGSTQLLFDTAVPNEVPGQPFSCQQGGGGQGLDPKHGSHIISSDANGTLCTQTYEWTNADDNGNTTRMVTYGTWYQLADGSVVGVLEQDRAGTPQHFAQSDLNKIAQDQSLVFSTLTA